MTVQILQFEYLYGFRIAWNSFYFEPRYGKSWLQGVKIVLLVDFGCHCYTYSVDFYFIVCLLWCNFITHYTLTLWWCLTHWLMIL